MSLLIAVVRRRLLAIFFLSLPIQTAAVANQCIPNGDQPRCIHLVDAYLDVASARQYCISHHSCRGDLAAIHNAFENNLLVSMMASESPPIDGDVWTGGRCNDNNACNWDDGTRFEFGNFPSDYNTKNGDCIVMCQNTQDQCRQSQWKTAPCNGTHRMAFFCEYYNNCGTTMPTTTSSTTTTTKMTTKPTTTSATTLPPTTTTTTPTTTTTATTTPRPPPPTHTPTCSLQVVTYDVVILLDMSSNMGPANFQAAKAAIIAFASQYTWFYTKFALVGVNANANTYNTFNSVSSLNAFINVVNAVQYTPGVAQANYIAGLTAADNVFTTQNGCRPGAHQMLIYAVGSEISDSLMTQATSQARQLRHGKGVDMVGMAVQPAADVLPKVAQLSGGANCAISAENSRWLGYAFNWVEEKTCTLQFCDNNPQRRSLQTSQCR